VDGMRVQIVRLRPHDSRLIAFVLNPRV